MLIVEKRLGNQREETLWDGLTTWEGNKFLLATSPVIVAFVCNPLKCMLQQITVKIHGLNC